MKGKRKKIKHTIKLITLVLMLICLSACNFQNDIERSNENKYKVVEVGGFDNAPNDEFAHNFEFFFEDDYIVDESKQSKTKKFTINGQKYSFKYEKTRKGYLYNDEIDIYVCTENDDVTIEYDAKEKMIRGIDAFSLVKDKLGTKTYGECLEIAREFLKEYTDEADAYTLTSSPLKDTLEVSESYSFWFYRNVAGIKTNDRAVISIRSSGDISFLALDSWESMSNAVYPTEEEMMIIESKISEKADSIFEPAKDKYTYSRIDESTKTEFLRLADGSYVLVYYLSYILTPLSDIDVEELDSSESLILMIYC